MQFVRRVAVRAAGALSTVVLALPTSAVLPAAGNTESPLMTPLSLVTSGAVAQTPAQVHLARLRARMATSASWTLALSDKAASSDLRGYSLVVVDGETTPASRVKALHAAGSIVCRRAVSSDPAWLSLRRFMAATASLTQSATAARSAALAFWSS